MVGKPLAPSSHPNKEVRAVLTKWVDAGWILHEASHWGTLWCTCESQCTSIPISRTPRNAGTHARRIDRLASRCPLPPDAAHRSLAGRPRKE